MVDVWWGVVEQTPHQYRWTPYQQLVDIVSNTNLTMQVVMSFRNCLDCVCSHVQTNVEPMWVISATYHSLRGFEQLGKRYPTYSTETSNME